MGTVLGLVGLATIVVALCGLVRPRIAWAHIHSRQRAGLALVLGLAVVAVGGALTPTPQDSRATVRSVTSDASPPAAEPATTPAEAGPSPADTTPAPVASTAVAPVPPVAAAVVPAAPAAVPPAATVAPADVPPAPAAAPVPVAPPATRAGVPAQRAPVPSQPAVRTSAAASPTGDTYTNVDGDAVPVPTHAAAAPAGATARCNDGTWSFSRHHSGTCSGHGGVAAWL